MLRYIYIIRKCWCLGGINASISGYKRSISTIIQEEFRSQTRSCIMWIIWDNMEASFCLALHLKYTLSTEKHYKFPEIPKFTQAPNMSGRVWCVFLTLKAGPGCAAGRLAVQIGLKLWALWNTTNLKRMMIRVRGRKTCRAFWGLFSKSSSLQCGQNEDR